MEKTCMTSVTLDWNDPDKLRAVQGLFAPDAALFQPIQTVPNGLSFDSSIARAEGEFPPPRHRPQLEAPKQHYMLDLLDLHHGVEKAVSKELGIFKTQSTIDLAQIEKLEKEKEETIKKNIEETASRNNWGVLSTVAQYLTPSASIAVGVSLGTGWGSFLIASGVAGLSNRIVRDTVGWQTVASWFTQSVENQKRLVRGIEMGFLAVEMGTGLAGGFGAALSGSFSKMAADATRLTAAKKISSTLQAAGTGLKVTSQLGKTFFDQKINDLQGRMRLLDAQAERIRMEMNQQVTDVRGMIDTAQEIGREMHKAVAASEVQE
jgi:hypothetical protein